jgi:UDP-N-acetylmuramoyl-L-alanyl-D-glutamate--2,6-diaminopimelate ligase
VLVIAGKGHETGQIIGEVVRPFDDAAEARAAVALLGGKS